MAGMAPKASKESALKTRPLSPGERRGLEKSLEFVREVEAALAKVSEIVKAGVQGKVSSADVVHALYSVQGEATSLHEYLVSIDCLKTMPPPKIGPNGVETATSRQLRESIEAARKGELPVQKKREWHGCTNPKGHDFEDGVCNDCGWDTNKSAAPPGLCGADAAKPPPKAEETHEDPNPAFRKPLFAPEERLHLGKRGFSEEDVRKIRRIAERLVAGQIVEKKFDPDDPVAFKAAVKQAGLDAVQAYTAALEYISG
jgi:hypothetical protein